MTIKVILLLAAAAALQLLDANIKVQLTLT